MREDYDGYIDKVWNLSADGRMSYDIFTADIDLLKN